MKNYFTHSLTRKNFVFTFGKTRRYSSAITIQGAGVLKNFVEAMNKAGVGYIYLKESFLRLVMLKSEIFVGQ